jgi:hypothetical protein
MEQSNIPNKQSQQTIQQIVIKLAEQKTKHMPAKQHNHSQTPHSPPRDKSTDDRQDYVSTQPTADSYIVTYDTDPFKTINKRSNPAQKGESPAAKRSHPKKKSGRNESILVAGNGSGAGRGKGPGRGKGQPSHSDIKTNLANRYAPLATSTAPSSSGSTK